MKWPLPLTSPMLSSPWMSGWRILRINDWTACSVVWTPNTLTPTHPHVLPTYHPWGWYGDHTKNVVSNPVPHISKSRRLVTPVITTVVIAMFNRTRWNAAQYQPSEPNVIRAEIVQQGLQAAKLVLLPAFTGLWYPIATATYVCNWYKTWFQVSVAK